MPAGNIHNPAGGLVTHPGDPRQFVFSVPDSSASCLPGSSKFRIRRFTICEPLRNIQCGQTTWVLYLALALPRTPNGIQANLAFVPRNCTQAPQRILKPI